MSSRRSGGRSPDEAVSSSSTYFSSAERPIPAGSGCAVVDSCTSSSDHCSDDALDCRPVPSLRIQNTGQYRFSWPRRLEVVHNGQPRVMVMPDWAQSTPLDEEELPQGAAISESLFSSVVGVTSQDSEPVAEQPTSNKADSSSHTTDDRPGSCVDRSLPVTDAPTGCAASTEESCATYTGETRAEPAVTHPPPPDSPSRQCRSTVTASRRRESPITPSRQRGSPVTPSRQCGSPDSPSRQCRSPVTPSRQCESPDSPSRQRGSPVTPNRQRGSPVTPCRQLAGGCSKRERLTPAKTTPAKRVAFSPGAGGESSPRTGRSVNPGHRSLELMSNQWCLIPRTSFLDAALNPSLEPEGLHRYVGTVPCVVLLTPSKQITPPDSAERFLIYS